MNGVALLALEGSRHWRAVQRGDQGVGQILPRIFLLFPTSGDDGEDAFDIPAPRAILSSKGSVAFHNADPLTALGGVVGWFYSFDAEECP